MHGDVVIGVTAVPVGDGGGFVDGGVSDRVVRALERRRFERLAIGPAEYWACGGHVQGESVFVHATVMSAAELDEVL